MDDINVKILQQGFGIKLVSSYRTRTGLVCRTDRGLLELKKTYSDDVSLEAEYALKEYLISRGFDGLDRAYRTTEDMPCYRLDDAAYILVRYTPSRRMDFEDMDDMKETSAALASFHNAAEGFDDERIRAACGSADDFFSKRAGEFSRIRKRIKTFGDYTPVDLMIIKYYDYYMDRIKQASELLEGSNFRGAVKMAGQTKTVCHNSFKNDNVRKAEDGGIIVSGLDGCTIDVSVTDTAHLIRRYMKSDAAGESGISEIIESYASVRPLSENDLGIIKGMLVYPYKFLKLCNEHYNKRRVCISEAAVERFENCLERRDKEVKLAMSI